MLAAAVPLGPPARADGPLVVSAAISLTDALREIETAYRAQGGGALTFNFAGSNVLSRQIVNGAPADLFISADQAQMDYAADRGAIDSAAVVPLLRNRLAIVTPAGRGEHVRDLDTLVGARRIAIGDPAGVPVGVYAKRYLEAAGVWQSLRSKLLPLASARSVLTAAASGSVDAAVVYESDLATSARVELGYIVSGPFAPEIIYPAAIVARSKNKATAGRFLEFLRTPVAARIFERHRFCLASLPSDDGPPASGRCASVVAPVAH